jgi:hypothetical protein
MKKTNLFFSTIIALLAINLVFISCEKDDPILYEDEPEDIMIPIDENSAFNMKNFIISFDQLFNARDRWVWNFSHDYTAGKAITSSQDYKICGRFGEGYFTITHIYNNDGVVTSSERVGTALNAIAIIFTYEFDREGFITKLTKKEADKIKDIVYLEYNEDNQLVKKAHLVIKPDSEEWYETFTYNSDRTVASYRNSVDVEKEEYSYLDGNMVETNHYKDRTIESVDKIEYDNNARMIKMYNDDTWYSAIEYSSDLMTFSGYDGDLLTIKEEYITGLKCIKSYSYYYNDSVFKHCITNENDENNEVKKKCYNTGTISNLQLIAYSVIDSRDSSSREKLKESIYNSSDVKLYDVEFTVSDGIITETNWFDANGSPIEESEINESWVFDLVNN